MNTTKIKITDLASLQMEKQRLKMQVEFSGEQIIEKVNGLWTNYPTLLASTMPFSNEQNQKVSTWLEWLNSFLFDKIFSSRKAHPAKDEIYKFLIRLTQVFVIRTLGRMWKKK